MNFLQSQALLVAILAVGHPFLAQGGAEPSFADEQQGFCKNGFFQFDSANPESLPDGREIWGSYCRGGDKDVGYLKTRIFTAKPTFQLYLTGYPARSDVTLEVENIRNGIIFPIQIVNIPHENWRRYRFSLPRDWQGDPVRLIARDQSRNAFGWLAMSAPTTGEETASKLGDLLLVLTPLVVSIFFVGLKFFVGACVTGRIGHTHPSLLGLAGLASVGIDGYLSFWLWFSSPVVGRWSNIVLPIVYLAFVLDSLRKFSPSLRHAFMDLLTPLLLLATAALLVLSVGFVNGGLDQPLHTASTRFSHQLPMDNRIPYLFASSLVDGQIKRPLAGDWLSSDRPPLQTGLYLAQRKFLQGELPYEVLSVVFQCLWIPALWFFIKASQVNARAGCLAILVCLLNGFVFLNSFYTWPKLLAATYAIAFAALGLNKALFNLCLKDWRISVLAGVMVSLAMLSHGGSMFGIAGIAICSYFGRRISSLRAVLTILGCAALLYLPWTLYQKLSDPPGTRLLKWHLAGSETADARPFLEVLRQAYSKLTFQEWLSGRITNVLEITGHEHEYWVDASAVIGQLKRDGFRLSSKVTEAVSRLRTRAFFHLAPCLGPLALALFALLSGLIRRADSPEWRVASQLWATNLVTCVVWCLLLITPGSTVLHQGSYSLVLLGILASILTLWSNSLVLAYCLAGLSVCSNLCVYLFLAGPPSDCKAIWEIAFDNRFASVALVSLILIVVCLYFLSAVKVPSEVAEESNADIRAQILAN